jgi:hypothetical protein
MSNIVVLCCIIFFALDELRVATYIVIRTALYIWQVSKSIIISTNMYPIGTLSRVTSCLEVHRSYWAPGLGEYLWYHH